MIHGNRILRSKDFIADFMFLLEVYILSNQSDCTPTHSTGVSECQYPDVVSCYPCNQQVLFHEMKAGMNGQKSPDFTETCRYGEDTMLSRMFQVMERFQLNECMVAEDTVLGYTVVTRRMKAYSFTTKSGKNVLQIIL